MAITHKFTRDLPAPTATHSNGFLFIQQNFKRFM